MNIIDAAKQALEALEYYDFGNGTPQKAASALRAAIQEAEKQEPIGYFYCDDNHWQQAHDDTLGFAGHTPLFTHPAPTPAGYALVPIEPTKRMLNCARDAGQCEGVTTTSWLQKLIYKAMIAASQGVKK